MPLHVLSYSTDFWTLGFIFYYFQKEEYPKILMGLFIEKPTPFIPEFLNRMMRLDYPKKRIDLLIHTTVSTAFTVGLY